MQINLSKYFQFASIACCEITILNFITLGWKADESDIAHLFEGGTTLKILSEIKLPLAQSDSPT